MRFFVLSAFLAPDAPASAMGETQRPPEHGDRLVRFADHRVLGGETDKSSGPSPRPGFQHKEHKGTQSLPRNWFLSGRGRLARGVCHGTTRNITELEAALSARVFNTETQRHGDSEVPKLGLRQSVPGTRSRGTGFVNFVFFGLRLPREVRGVHGVGVPASVPLRLCASALKTSPSACRKVSCLSW